MSITYVGTITSSLLDQRPETVVLYVDVITDDDTTTHYVYLTSQQVQEIVAIDLAARLTR